MVPCVEQLPWIRCDRSGRVEVCLVVLLTVSDRGMVVWQEWLPITATMGPDLCEDVLRRLYLLEIGGGK